MTIQLRVPGMACGSCGKTITKAIQSVDPSAEVQTDSKSKQVTVESNASESSIMEILDRAGYCATLAKPFFYEL